MKLVSKECDRRGARLPGEAATSLVTCSYCGTTLRIEHDDPDVQSGVTVTTRSEDTRRPLSVSFVNGRGRPLDIVWLDFEGADKGYGRVEPGQIRSFSTFVSHVWSLREEGSGVEVLRWAAPDQAPRRVTVR